MVFVEGQERFPGMELCGVKTRDGDPCLNPPTQGGKRCRMHGGSGESAHRQRLEAKIRGRLAYYEIEPVTDPLARYAELAGEILAWMDACRDQVRALESWDYHDDKGVNEAKAYVQIYERAIDRAQRVLYDMLRLGLDAQALKQGRERPSREQAEVLGAILFRVFAEIGLSAEQQELARRSVAQHLGAIAGQTAVGA